MSNPPVVEPMTEQRAREILGDAIEPNNGLFGTHAFLAWTHGRGQDRATLDGDFTADQLEAIAWWMRHKRQEIDT